MIGFLQGMVRRSAPERLLLDVSGVGYDVHIPLSTYYEIEKRGAEPTVGLFVHTHVREDALELYGFWTERERQLFERLIAVNGIGPKLARVILSGMPPADLLAAVAAGDVARLTKIPGVGKKTSERIVLEIKDKVQALAAELPELEPATDSDDLLSALENLGYKRSVAERALGAVREELPDGAFHELLRATLSRLSRA